MNPFAAWDLATPKPAATRRLELLGGEVELRWLPERARRRAAPAALHQDHASRILANETLWQSDNQRAALILWSVVPLREADADLIERALALAEPHGGTVLMNTLGAAATQPRAHLHVVGERLPFLSKLPALPCARPLPDDLTSGRGAIEVVELAPPFPGLAFGLRGERPARARAAARLLQLRAALAANLISDGTTTWVIPRGVETPAPHFPYPLGCAELWGRFCFEDEATFAAATADSLRAAFAMALVPR
jgi:hypothetical protein